MFGDIKLFLLSYGSIGIFWLFATVFCYVGTEAGRRKKITRLLLGSVFMLVFACLVLSLGVPRYFVYDHVQPQTIGAGVYYPAVKNHMIFQGASFKTYGVISKDLQDFKSSDKLFLQFKVKPLSKYPSVKGLKGYANELFLLSLFFMWFFFINKLHNASVSDELYEQAVAKPNLANYRSYIIASESIRFFRVIKRRRAHKAIKTFRILYVTYLIRVLDKMALDSDERVRTVLNSLSSHFGSDSFLSTEPSYFRVGVNLEEYSLGVLGAGIEEGVAYGRDYCVPTEEELERAVSDKMVVLLNAFLPEGLLSVGMPSSEVGLSCGLVYYPEGQQAFKSGKTSLKIAYKDRAEGVSVASAGVSQTIAVGFPSTVVEGKQGDTRALCAMLVAEQLVNSMLFVSDPAESNIKRNTEHLKSELAVMKSDKEDLFETLYKACESEVKKGAVILAVKHAMDANEALVDSCVAETYQFMANNPNALFDILQQASGGEPSEVEQLFGSES
jgi:hypothetical protein